MEPSLAYRDAMGMQHPKATPADAFREAEARVLRGERLDMAALAHDLGVARATLYRWTGDRDSLLADVLWAQMDAVLSATSARIASHGKERIGDVAGSFLEVIAGSPVLRSFIANEGAGGVQVLTAPNGPFRPRLVARVTEMIDEVAARDGYVPPAPAASLADGIVSLGERYLHNGGDPSLNPDPATAKLIVGLLLREN